MLKELPARARSGFIMIPLLLLAQVLSIFLLVTMPPLFKIPALLAAILCFVCWFGFYMVHPNQSAVQQLFGRYDKNQTNRQNIGSPPAMPGS